MSPASGFPPPSVNQLAAPLLAGLLRDNDHRPFGACHTCRNFRRDAPGGGPHWCALLQQPLSEPDSLAICAEHEPRAA